MQTKRRKSKSPPLPPIKLSPRTGKLRALFTGPDEAGKLAAAQQLAAQLDRNLYRVDLSAIVSKYIGETEKYLDRLFARAENTGSVLFFDEADALFGTRTTVKDSHDRYANQEISHLLQRLEACAGAAIITLNRKGPLAKIWRQDFLKVVNFPRRRRKPSG